MASTIRIYYLPGLHCADEFAQIARRMRRLEGVEDLAPDYLDRTLQVQFDGARLTADEIEAELYAAGFPPLDVSPAASASSAPAQPADATAADAHAGAVRAAATAIGSGRADRVLAMAAGGKRRGELPIAAPELRFPPTVAIGGALLAAALVGEAVRQVRGDVLAGYVPAGGMAAVAGGLALAAALTAGFPIARSGWRALRAFRCDMHVLVTLAAIGAIAIGQRLEAAATLVLFAFSLWLEEFTRDRAHRAITSLLRRTAPVAHRRAALAEDGRDEFGASLAPRAAWEDLPAEDLRPGDEVLIRPGELVPADARVLRGTSAADESVLTGESLPIDKAPGDLLLGGSLNGEGALQAEVLRAAEDSTLARVARLVHEARRKRSHTERFVDRFAAWYTPVVTAAAVLTALGPPLSLWLLAEYAGTSAEAQWLTWIYRGLVLLVIACPCALVISTPITVVAGLYRAARDGMLVKGGEHLEALGRLKCFAFDKTGTLTAGAPCVAAVATAPGVATEELLRIAAALELQSEHPLARAVIAEARDRGVAFSPAENVAALRGFGIAGEVDGQPCVVGSPSYFREQGWESARMTSTEAGAATVAWVACDGRWLGEIAFRDPLRPEAAAALAALRRMGIEHVIVLSGDRESAVAQLAAEAGADQWRAGLLPDQKVAEVHRLTKAYRGLAMVGDGVNDAPALAAASVGVAIGARASDVALESADVALLSSDLAQLPNLVRLSRRMRSILRQNILCALGIKAITLALAIAGCATLWMAVAADVGASLLVVASGMRLLRR